MVLLSYFCYRELPAPAFCAAMRYFFVKQAPAVKWFELIVLSCAAFVRTNCNNKGQEALSLSLEKRHVKYTIY